jgi:hypothetical protein
MGSQAPLPIVERASDSVLQYGAIGAIALVFAIAIIVLYKQSLKREDKLDAEREAMIKERKDWEIQEAKLRSEYDQKLAAASEKYAAAITELNAKAQLREDTTRREFAEIMEHVDEQAGKASAALVAMLEKFYNRFVGPRPGH